MVHWKRMRGARVVWWAAALVCAVGRGAMGQDAPAPGSPASAPVKAQAAPNDVNELLAPIREKHAVPALAAVVIEGRLPVAQGAVGRRAANGPEPVAAGDLWHLGSCTKAMTATLIGLLVEQGKLRWETTVAEGLPELAAEMDPGWKAVTLAHLLSHRGGVPASPPPEAWLEAWRREGTPRQQRVEFARAILKAPPESAPGTKFVYSNQGYAIAGAIAERAMDEEWEALIMRLVFKPIGITTAGFGAPGTAEVVDQPRGHAHQGEEWKPAEPGPRADNPPAIGPGGTAHMSMADWGLFVGEHLVGGRGESKLATRETFEKLRTPPFGGEYAMGWGIAQRPWGGRVITHSGSNTMWFCVVWASPEKDFAVLVATNCGGDAAAKACDDAAGTLIGAYQAGRFTTPPAK